MPFNKSFFKADYIFKSEAPVRDFKDTGVLLTLGTMMKHQNNSHPLLGLKSLPCGPDVRVFMDRREVNPPGSGDPGPQAEAEAQGSCLGSGRSWETLE